MSHDVVDVARHWDVQALEVAARHEHNARVCRRILAMLHLARGHTVAQTAGQFALGQSVLYDWARRYDAEGLKGLHDRPRSEHSRRTWHASMRQRFCSGCMQNPTPWQRLGRLAGRATCI